MSVLVRVLLVVASTTLPSLLLSNQAMSSLQTNLAVARKLEEMTLNLVTQRLLLEMLNKELQLRLHRVQVLR